MTEPSPQPPSSEFAEREYQDPHYHDEEPEIQNDDLPRPISAAPPRRRPVRIPQPRRRFEED